MTLLDMSPMYRMQEAGKRRSLKAHRVWSLPAQVSCRQVRVENYLNYGHPIQEMD
jgi:hypothetical protein